MKRRKFIKFIGGAAAASYARVALHAERHLFLGADVVLLTEGNTEGRDVIASARTARRGRRHWHVRTLLAREPGDLAIDRLATATGPCREGEEP